MPLHPLSRAELVGSAPVATKAVASAVRRPRPPCAQMEPRRSSSSHHRAPPPGRGSADILSRSVGVGESAATGGTRGLWHMRGRRGRVAATLIEGSAPVALERGGGGRGARRETSINLYSF
jgi:hypothetical protein